MTRLYQAYGLAIASELALPELIPALAGEAGADVTIKFGGLRGEGLDGGVQLGPFLWASPGEFLLRVPRVARFLVRGGDQVEIDPEPEGDEDSIRVFLLGSVIAALLFQRGRLLLHGNAVMVGDGCVVCVGRSGAGKSTLAAGFQRRGHRILADDVVAVDDECRALPGFPRLKLWQDVTDRLDLETAALRRVRPNMNKFSVPLAESFASAAAPIRAIYLLHDDHVDALQSERIEGMAKFMRLRHNTYRARYLDGMALKGRHLELCSRLANRVDLVKITRPRRGFTLEPLIDLILQDASAEA